MVVGIDISKLKFDVCCLFDGKKSSKVFSNDEAGFVAFLEWVKDLNTASSDVHYCMEATGCYHEALAEHLHGNGCKVSVVKGLLIKRFRECKTIRNKTDRADAFAIAEFCLQNNPRAWTPKPLETKELQDLNKYIHYLKIELNRWGNRLEKKHCNKKVEEGINKKIEQLTEEIKELEEEIQNLIDKSPNLAEKAQNLGEIAGVGPKTILAVLAEMPDVNNFKNAEQYAAFVGVTPCHYSSGTSVRGQSRISRQGNSGIRKTLYMAGLSVKRYNPHFAKWIQKLENKGKPPKVIIMAIVRKLLHIIFKMLKSNQKFDPRLAFM